MQLMRLFLAALAATAVIAVGAVVALAAPGSVGRALSPQGGAATAVYCPNGLVKQLKTTVSSYRKRMVADRTRYFRAHKSAKQRAAFARLQTQQLAALQKKLAKCS
jgi:hypothetical protein